MASWLLDLVPVPRSCGGLLICDSTSKERALYYTPFCASVGLLYYNSLHLAPNVEPEPMPTGTGPKGPEGLPRPYLLQQVLPAIPISRDHPIF